MTYRNVHDRQEEIRRMTDQELRLALDERPSTSVYKYLMLYLHQEWG
jgi:hypothetical protein